MGHSHSAPTAGMHVWRVSAACDVEWYYGIATLPSQCELCTTSLRVRHGLFSDFAGPPTPGPSVWVWQNDHASFNAYDPSASKILEDAIQAGKPSAQLKFGSSVYVVNFSTMTQVNSRTGFSRPVRRVSAATLGMSAASAFLVYCCVLLCCFMVSPSLRRRLCGDGRSRARVVLAGRFGLETLRRRGFRCLGSCSHRVAPHYHVDNCGEGVPRGSEGHDPDQHRDGI